MKNNDMNGFHADLFRTTVNSLIAKEVIPKGREAARIFNLTYDKYKNVCIERTPLTPEQYGYFISVMRKSDNPEFQHEYKWILKQLLGE